MGKRLTGGCQCGAIRFAATELGRSSVCHCRMCQKAFGGLFAPLVSAPDGCWTRGEPKWFASSSLARRAFCAHCGTPLAYETRFGLELAVGAFDDPDQVRPTIQVNLNDKLACYDSLSSLPQKEHVSSEWADFLAQVRSFQHPDHETTDWEIAGSPTALKS